MALSNDLISQFVKITNDNSKKKTETTVYGTVVDYSGKNYVRLDGSDLLTPISTTTDAKPGERVTVMIKNHNAVVTGNISSPAARTDDVSEVKKTVEDLDLDSVNSKISEFEIILADKVDTEVLNAEKARIDTLVSENVKIKEELTATTANVENLNAETANISEKLTSSEAEIETLKTTKLDASVADITYATIEGLEATDATIHNLEATYADFARATADRLTAAEAVIEDLDATYATVQELDAVKGRVTDLEAELGDIDTLIFGSATGDTIQTSFSNSVIAQLGDAQIKSAMIDSVSANKITAGDIDTNNVRIKSEDGTLIISDETMQISDSTRVRVQIGKDASNDYSINVWDADGNLMFSKGGITDSAIKDAIIRNDMVSDTANIAAHKLDIDSLFEEINGSANTIKSTKIYLDDEKQTLDLAFKSLTSDVNDLGETVSSQGTQISAIQGQISSKIWQQDINKATGDMSTQYSTLDQKIDGVSATVASNTSTISKKADSTTVTNVSNKLATLETNLSGFQSSVSETYATKTEVDSIEVGGRNLILNGSFETNSSNWSYNSANPFVYLPTGGYNGDGALELTVTTPGTVVPRQDTSFTFAAGTSLICSVKVKEVEGSWGTDAYARWANLYSVFYSYHKALGDGWTLYVYQATLTEDLTTTASNVFGFAGMGIGTFIIDEIKLEKGNKATDWTAAPEDLDAELSAIESRVSTAETSISQNTQAISLTATKTEVATAKSEAISAASSDATAKANNALSNANSNTTNLLKNYSTTSQMNAAIEVSADNIINSVSSTYATKEELDSLEVGGRNLLLNSSFTNGTSKWSCTGNSMSIVDGYSGDGLQIVITANGTVTPRQGLTFTLKAGETLTGSVKVKVVEGDFSEYAIRFAGLFTMYVAETKPINDDWTLYIYRGTATSDMTFTSSNVIGFAYGANGTYIIDDFKLERGDKATDWTPAPEDIDTRIASAESSITQLSNKITSNVTETTNLGNRMTTVEQTANSLSVEVDDAAKTATNYMQFSSSGLVVGDMTKSTLGKNVLIDSDSVDIRNGSTVMASFGANTVTLGRNAEDSVIDLCNGAGKISANTASAATSFPNRNAILIESQEIETESVRFVASTSNKYGASSTPSIVRGTELYMLRSTSTSGESCARLKAEHKTTSSGAYTNSGVSAMTYDSASSTRVMVYASDSANSSHNQVNVYPTKTTMNKNLVLNGTTFTGKNKVLWTGGYYMSDTQTATLSEAISAQANGVVLVWSYYTDGANDNSNFHNVFIPKHFISLHAGKGVSMFLTNASLSIVAGKYVYVSDTSIKGYSSNNANAGAKDSGLTASPKYFVLRYVIGV